MTEYEERESNLSQHFPAPVPLEHPLPHLFDDKCKECDDTMERVPVSFWVRRRPFAVFNCSRCKIQLYLFEAKTAPLFVWSTECKGTLKFSEFIDQLEKERDEKRIRREIRSGEAVEF